jgi:hypothetical protein
MILYFENLAKCSLVKTKLDMAKKALKQSLITEAAGYLEACMCDVLPQENAALL